jgi:TonB-dependent Receptor Plug Domain
MRDIRSNQDDRIYLHYDKPYYQAGTNIWFRVYMLKDLSGRISGNQNNIYVTLANGLLMLPCVRMVDGKLAIRSSKQFVAGAGFIEPLVFVNGVKTVSTNVAAYLNSIPTQNIDSKKVIKGEEASMYGTGSANGVILVKLVYTLRPVADAIQNGIQFIFPVGYQKKTIILFPSL